MFKTYEMTVIKKGNGNEAVKGQVTVLDIEYIKMVFLGYGYDVLRCREVALNQESASQKAQFLLA